MNTGLLAYLLLVSAFSATIFCASVPLIPGSHKGLPTKIYLAGIFVALSTSLLTFIFIALKTGSLYFEDQNSFLELFPIAVGLLVPLALYLQPFFLRASRRPITKLGFVLILLPVLQQLVLAFIAVAYGLSPLDLAKEHPYLTVLRTAAGFLIPAAWLFYESIKISKHEDSLLIRWIIFSSGMGVALGTFLLAFIFYQFTGSLTGLEDGRAALDQVVKMRIFRGSFYCIFQLLIFFYWYNKYSSSAIRLAERREKVDSLLVEKDLLIENLASKNALVETGALSAGLAHELNQFLARIEINGGEALHQINKPDINVDDLKPALKNILDANHSAATLIASLKMLFRGNQEKPTLCDIDKLITDVVSLYKDRTIKSKIQIKLDLKANAEWIVWNALLRQVVVNLISNAIDSLDTLAHENKMICIESKIDERGWYRLSVTDNGPGIAPEQEQKLFGLFSTSKSSGTGIGLWLSRYIVERHQGILSFESPPDHGGVTFFATFPPGEALAKEA